MGLNKKRKEWKIMKKVIGVLLSIFMIMATLVGCGKTEDDVKIRIGALKGPTSMGMLFMQENENYDFVMATGADELLPMMIKGELDIALIPANVASILYNKTQGGISVIDINTLFSKIFYCGIV